MAIGLNFIGLVYLVVYVGAISILFLFILMLINIRLSELDDNTLNSIPLASCVALVIASLVVVILANSNGLLSPPLQELFMKLAGFQAIILTLFMPQASEQLLLLRCAILTSDA